MPDTVGIKHFYQYEFCSGFRQNWKFLSWRKNKTWTLNYKGEETLPNLTMTNTPNGIWHLSAQVSLPKMLFGHNAKLPTQDEIEQGLKMISEYVEAQSGFPFDYASASVYLIHYAYDVHLGESQVWRTIKKLSEKKMPPLRKNFYEDATIYFTAKDKSRQIRIYPKLQDVLAKSKTNGEAVKMADGVLRFEDCYLRKHKIDALVKELSLPDRTTQNLLTEQVSDFTISRILENLDFFNLLSTDKTKLDLLLEHYTLRKAKFLFGFLQMVEEHGKDFYKYDKYNYSKDSYRRCVTDCKKAKVW